MIYEIWLKRSLLYNYIIPFQMKRTSIHTFNVSVVEYLFSQMYLGTFLANIKFIWFGTSLHIYSFIKFDHSFTKN